MCRLLGYVAERPASVTDLLGTAYAADFAALTRVHGDGWGMAWRGADGRIATERAPQSAASDPDYHRLVEAELAQIGLVHLRWATDGLEVGLENTHPFSDGELALAHNGSISPIARIDGLLTPASREHLRGDTDSERYFQFLRQSVAEATDTDAGVRSGISILADAFPAASLNAILLAPDAMYVVHVNSGARAPIDDLRILLRDEPPPAGHATAYFEMAYRVTPTSVVVASSGLVGSDWQPVPPDSVIRIGRCDREVSALWQRSGHEAPAGRPSSATR
ncbi:MAG: class II glutamine amidotransferase [Nocardioides sp.]|uniref:class II glutamine amidotransferase n=1 Tax=Nocardioides sp. TaxID=35761 RepID=UPI0039E34770